MSGKALRALAVVGAVVVMALSASGERLDGKVVEVVDGDTLKMLVDEKPRTIELNGLDCPEPDQPFGPQAKQYTENLVLNKQVAAVLVQPKKPQEGETEPKPPSRASYAVTLPDGTNVNHALLAAGMAWYYDKDVIADKKLCGLAAKAIGEKKGLWSDAAPLAPWDFRVDALKELAATVPPPEPGEGTANDEVPRVLALKGDHDIGPRPIFPQFQENPLYKQAAPRWHKNEQGAVVGVTADNISSLPFASMFGFRDGDVVQSVNGDAVNSEAAIMRLAEKYKNASSLRVGIVRNGKPQTINIDIPDFLR